MKKTAIIVFITLLVLSVGSILIYNNWNKPKETMPSAQNTRLTIELKNGKLLSAPSTYLVQPGTKLEFQINSDKLGKIFLTEPAQTITFTESPLIFHFNAPTKPGNYPMAYQANGSKQVIQIGDIVVKDNSKK